MRRAPLHAVPPSLIPLALALALASGCMPWGGRPRPAAGKLPIPSRVSPAPPPLPTDAPPPSGQLRVPTAHGGGWKTLQWDKRSASVGKPNGGRLVDGRPLPPEGPGWVCRSERVYGTDETLLMLSWAFAEVQRRYPGSAPVVVGDISDEGGGRLRPHRSHQSGRDADVGYFHVGNAPLRTFQPADGASLDAEKTWALLEFLLLTGEVLYLFIDRSLQPALYDAGRAQGWQEDALDELFQYRHAPGSRRGVIRHAAGHRDHFHVRFRCPRGDDDCED